MAKPSHLHTQLSFEDHLEEKGMEEENSKGPNFIFPFGWVVVLRNISRT